MIALGLLAKDPALRKSAVDITQNSLVNTAYPELPPEQEGDGAAWAVGRPERFWGVFRALRIV